MLHHPHLSGLLTLTLLVTACRSWSKNGFIDSILSEYRKFDQAGRADTAKDGIITEPEFMYSLYKQADANGNNDNQVSRDEFIDYYSQRYNISSELATVMFDYLNDRNSYDEVITPVDVSIVSFVGKNYATVVEYRDGLEKWVRQSADKLYTTLMSPHVIGTRREPELKYNNILSNLDTNKDEVISIAELNDELKRYNPSQPVKRRDWVWRNTQRYGASPNTSNLAFDYWDRDRDMELTARDLQVLVEDMDLNGDKKISRPEFVRFYERGYQLSKRMTGSPLPLLMIHCPDPWWNQMGWSPNIDATRAAMDFDDDLNGWVTLADLRRWLGVFDQDDDGSIDRREHRDFHTERYGVNSTVASAMFDLADTNGDDKLDEQDWEFHFTDEFSLSFCDARRSILDLTRMAEQFRTIRQGRELRDAMQRRLQEEWSWYLQNRQQRQQQSFDWLTGGAKDRGSSVNRNEDLCGSSVTCYVGEYTEAWRQPGAWLWWAMKEGQRIGESRLPGQMSGAPRPMGGVPGPLGALPRPLGGLPGPALDRSATFFGQPQWPEMDMRPIGGLPYLRYRRSTDGKANSEKSHGDRTVNNNKHYFSNYQRLYSPFAEPAKEEATPTPRSVHPVFSQQEARESRVPEQDSSGSTTNPNLNQNNLNAHQNSLNNHETQGVRAPSSTSDQSPTESNTDTPQISDNQSPIPNWMQPPMPVVGYPFLLGFDPWMLGGVPNWGMFGRKKREPELQTGGELGADLEENEPGKQKREAMNSSDSNKSSMERAANKFNPENVGDNENSTSEEQWNPVRPLYPMFGMTPLDLWMAWMLENAMWESLQHNDWRPGNSSSEGNETGTMDLDGFWDEVAEWSVQQPSTDAGDEEENYDSRGTSSKRSDRDKRFAWTNGNIFPYPNWSSLPYNNKMWRGQLAPFFASYWPFMMTNLHGSWNGGGGRPFFPYPFFARYWPFMLANFQGYGSWNGGGGRLNFPYPWSRLMMNQYPYGYGGPWNYRFLNFRNKRNIQETETSNTNDTDSQRQQRSDEKTSSDSTEDSVWRSASNKYSTETGWKQDMNPGSERWSEGANDRYGFTTPSRSGGNMPTSALPTQGDWLRNFLPGTSADQSMPFKPAWGGMFGQQSFPWSGRNFMQQPIWDNTIPRTPLSSIMSPGPGWPEWGGSVGFDGQGRSTFGNLDPAFGFPWQSAFGGSPRSYTDSNWKRKQNLWNMWYGRFARQTQNDNSEPAEEKEGQRRKRDTQETGGREKRWGSDFIRINSPFLPYQGMPKWYSLYIYPWCQNYWNSIRLSRDTSEPADSDKGEDGKRSAEAESDKAKRWDDFTSNQQGSYDANSMLSMFGELICPAVWNSMESYNMPANTLHQYLQFRKKRESEANHVVYNTDTGSEDIRDKRWNEWGKRYENEYDCIEWASSTPTWTPWRGWNMLRSARETPVNSDSVLDEVNSAQGSGFSDKNNRAVRCRSWFRKNSNNYDQNYNNQRGPWSHGRGWDLTRDFRTAAEELQNQNSAKPREKRESDRPKRENQWNFRSPAMSPYTNSRFSSGQDYPLYYDGFGWPTNPMQYPSSYGGRWNSMSDMGRIAREEDATTRHRRGSESAIRSRLFWNLGQESLRSDDDIEGRQKREADSEVKEKRMANQYPEWNWGQNGNMHSEMGARRMTNDWNNVYGYDGRFGSRPQRMQTWMDSSNNPSFPQSWKNSFSRPFLRTRRDTASEANPVDMNRDKRFTFWTDFNQNIYNDNWNRQTSPFLNTYANWWHPEWQNQWDPWRFTRDTDAKEQRKKRDTAESLRGKRDPGLPGFYPGFYRKGWPSNWGNLNVHPRNSNYWGFWPTVYFPNWYGPSSFRNTMRYPRYAKNNGQEYMRPSGNSWVNSYAGSYVNPWRTMSDPYNFQDGQFDWNARYPKGTEGNRIRRSANARFLREPANEENKPGGGGRKKRDTKEAASKTKRWWQGHDWSTQWPNWPGNQWNYFASMYNWPSGGEWRGDTWQFQKGFDRYKRETKSESQEEQKHWWRNKDKNVWIQGLWRGSRNSLNSPSRHKRESESNEKSVRDKGKSGADSRDKRWNSQLGLGNPNSFFNPWNRRPPYSWNNNFRSPFGSEWQHPMWRYPRETETENTSARRKQETQFGSRTKRWEGYPWYSRTLDTPQWNWQSYDFSPQGSYSKWMPQGNWRQQGTGYWSDGSFTDQFRYPRTMDKSHSEKRLKREVQTESSTKSDTESEDRKKRWPGYDWNPPSFFEQTDFEHPLTWTFNLGDQGAEKQRPQWKQLGGTIFGNMRFPRQIQNDSAKGNVNETAKTKRWQESGQLPWLGYSQRWQWYPQDRMNTWNQAWNRRVTFGENSWFPAQSTRWNGGNSNNLWDAANSMWRYPRTVQDDATESSQFGSSGEATRDKRWQNSHRTPMLNWSNAWNRGFAFQNPFFSRLISPWNTWPNSRSFDKRDTSESAKHADEELRTKRWHGWNWDYSNNLGYPHPPWFPESIFRWGPSWQEFIYDRYSRQVEKNNSETPQTPDKSKRDTGDNSPSKRGDERLNYANEYSDDSRETDQNKGRDKRWFGFEMLSNDNWNNFDDFSQHWLGPYSSNLDNSWNPWFNQFNSYGSRFYRNADHNGKQGGQKPLKREVTAHSRDKRFAEWGFSHNTLPINNYPSSRFSPYWWNRFSQSRSPSTAGYFWDVTRSPRRVYKEQDENQTDLQKREKRNGHNPWLGRSADLTAFDFDDNDLGRKMFNPFDSSSAWNTNPRFRGPNNPSSWKSMDIWSNRENDNQERSKRNADSSSRDKRWYDFFANSQAAVGDDPWLYISDQWRIPSRLSTPNIPWHFYPSYAWNSGLGFNSQAYLKRSTEESKQSESAVHNSRSKRSTGIQNETKTKRWWQFGNLKNGMDQQYDLRDKWRDGFATQEKSHAWPQELGGDSWNGLEKSISKSK